MPRAFSSRCDGLSAEPAKVTDLVDGQPVVEPFAPAMELGVERLGRDPALSLGKPERSGLRTVDRDVPFLLECRRRLRELLRERRRERAARRNLWTRRVERGGRGRPAATDLVIG